MTDSTLVPGSGGRGRKAIVLGAVALLVCGLCGGLGFFVWPKAGPDTSKLPPGGSLTGGDLAEVEIGAGVKMKFCWVPPGEAQLGSPKAERQEVLKLLKEGKEKLLIEDKEPAWLAAEAEEVRGKFKTKGFWLAKYPVTQEQWKAVMGNNPSYFSASGGGKDKVMGTDTSRFPVENVSWDDADHKEYSVQEFLKKMRALVKVPDAMGQGKFSLPHEDEWEYACRGGRGNQRAFYFGNSLKGDLANCEGISPYGTDVKGEYKERMTKVGDYEKLAPHPWGLCDMHGNVWQWCDNLYENDKNSRVLRGGSWNDLASFCRAARRFWFDPGFRAFGFRPCFRLD